MFTNDVTSAKQWNWTPDAMAFHMAYTELALSYAIV